MDGGYSYHRMLLPHPVVTDQLFALESRRNEMYGCHSTIGQNPFSPFIRSTDSPVGAKCLSQARVSCASSNDSQRDQLLQEMLIPSANVLVLPFDPPLCRLIVSTGQHQGTMVPHLGDVTQRGWSDY
jgi:hypothetical protein